ncbi:MAG: hypothetical protein U0625_09665 [Phycisphaerales bacterium]
MSIAGSRAKLKDAHRQLMVAWQRANETWDDPVAQALWRNHFEPLETVMRSTLNAMDGMNETLERIRRECGEEQ